MYMHRFVMQSEQFHNIGLNESVHMQLEVTLNGTVSTLYSDNIYNHFRHWTISTVVHVCLRLVKLLYNCTCTWNRR